MSALGEPASCNPAVRRDLACGSRPVMARSTIRAIVTLNLGSRLKAQGYPGGEALHKIGKALVMGLPQSEMEAFVAWASRTRAPLAHESPSLALLLCCSPEAEGVCTARFSRGPCRSSKKKKWTQKKRRHWIAALADHIVKPAFIYRHQWRRGDLLMWDNCSVQHRAIQDYDLPRRRLMHRTTMGGAPPV